MLDWIFEGIVNWISSIVSQMMDAVSGLFLQALGTDMTAMEEYFPFVSKAFTVMQYTAWAILFLVTVWQLFRVFGGPITEAENPWTLLARSSIFALLIGYAKPIFMITLDIARAPYTALMELTMTAEDFTFAGVEQALSNGLTTIVAVVSVVGLLLLVILEISLGWNYFKLLLETVERYIVVGVLCYTSPLAFSMGASKTTAPVFKSWCRMVGSQLLLLVMNVWFLRGFNSSMGQYIGNGGALSTGQGSIFLWLFCALAFLKTAQKFDSYLAAMGLNVAQTGSSMGMELLMAARVISGVGGGAKSAGSFFSKGGSAATGTGAAASGFASGFASKFKGNSYVRDAVVDGGVRMGAGGSVGFIGRAFGGMAARNGATLTGESISSVASRGPNVSGSIAGDIADRSLGNYMPQLGGYKLKDTQISGGQISTVATGADGQSANIEMYNASQFEKPDGPHSEQLEMALSKQAEPMAEIPCGITALIMTSRMHRTRLCNLPMAWTGMQCSSTLRLRSLSLVIQRLYTIRLSSSSLCRDMSSRYLLLTDRGVRMDALRFVMKTDRVPCSMIQHNMLLRAGIIRYLRMPAADSGMQYAEKPPWNADQCTKTENPFMMAKVFVLFQLKQCDISRHHHALKSRNREKIPVVSRQSARDNMWQKAGSGELVRLFCIYNKKKRCIFCSLK